jgi:hypothetical protein
MQVTEFHNTVIKFHKQKESKSSLLRINFQGLSIGRRNNMTGCAAEYQTYTVVNFNSVTFVSWNAAGHWLELKIATCA